MCSGCINDCDGLVGLCGAGKVPAELSALSRLEVTPEGWACSHLAARPRTCGWKCQEVYLIVCMFPSQNTMTASLQGPGQRD